MSSDSSREDPLFQPKIIKRLQGRERVVDMGLREEMLQALEHELTERRRPDNVSDRATREVAERARNSTEPVIKNRLRKRMEDANEGILSRL